LLKEISEKVFVRRATGLTRGISAHDAFIINLLGLAPTAALSAVLLVVPALYPGADIILAFLLITPIALAYAANYVALSSIMPRSGGDYVFNSRIVHPLWGLFAGVMFWVTVTLEIGVLAGFASGWYLGPLLAMTFPESPVVLAFCEALNDPLMIVAVGTLIIAFFTAVAVAGLKPWLYILRILYGVCIVSMILAIIVCVPYTRFDFINAFNAYADAYGASYEGILELAEAHGWEAPAFSWSATGMAVLYMIMFLTSTWVVFVGGEVKEGERNLPRGIWWSVVLAVIVCIVNSVLYFKVVPYDFTSALVYLSTVAPEAYMLPYKPTLNYLLGILTRSPIINFIVGFGIFFWTISWLPNMNVMSSRLLFALAFDRVIPAKLASIHTRTRTPVVSLLITGVLAEACLILAAYTNVIWVLMNISVMILMCYIWTGYAAAVLPFRRRDLFERAPAYVRAGIGKIPWVTITGLTHGVAFTILLALFTLVYPEMGGPVTFQSMGFIASILAGAAILYYAARWYRLKTEGIDIAWAFKEIPPA
jgi:amino acid transporter